MRSVLYTTFAKYFFPNCWLFYLFFFFIFKLYYLRHEIFWFIIFELFVNLPSDNAHEHAFIGRNLKYYLILPHVRKS